MALKERQAISKVEVLPSGHIQVRLQNQIYDDTVAPSAAKGVEGKDGYIEAVTDVKHVGKYHRYVVAPDETTPADVQAFLDNSKAK